MAFIEEFYLLFMPRSFDSYTDPDTGEQKMGREIGILYFDSSYNKFMPYKKTNKYTLEIYVYYQKYVK